ncbi:MAG: class I SAM-dependent methyltransferase [Actinomycetota bacterium]
MDKERVKQLNIETFDKWAPDYDKAFLAKHPQKLNQIVAEMVSAFLGTTIAERKPRESSFGAKAPQDDCFSLLDVGCGTGHFLNLLLNQPHGSRSACRLPDGSQGKAGLTAHGLRLAGIDISPGMLKIARERLGNDVDLQEGGVETLPWPDNTFEVITSTDAFHHFPDPNPALAEIRRVMQPNGMLIIADMWLPTPARQFFNLILPLTREGDVRIYSRRQMLSFMTMNGYRDISWKRFELLGQITTGLK